MSYSLNKTPNSTILLTADLEDWFQVENFKECISFSSWSSRDLRIEHNTHRLLDLFDKAREGAARYHEDRPSSAPVRATFFVLGWIAERLPSLIREIHSRGHEIASHGYNHELCKIQSEDSLKDDLIRSKKLLEEIIGHEVWGYRAPSFSIDLEILRSIRDSGYVYDSSYNSFSIHSRYGQLETAQNGNQDLVFEFVEGLYEIPISNLRVGNQALPWGGGAYLRLIPERLFRRGIRTILKRQQAYLLYIHPWEIDADQPRIKEASFFKRFRHYSNLEKTYPRLCNLIYLFHSCRFMTCGEYLTEVLGDTCWPKKEYPTQAVNPVYSTLSL